MLLHQLRLVYVCNPAFQFLRMFGEELELGAVTFGMLPGIVITDLSWRTEVKHVQNHSAAEVTTGRAWRDYFRSFMPRCTRWDEPDAADASLRAGADQASHL